MGECVWLVSGPRGPGERLVSHGLQSAPPYETEAWGQQSLCPAAGGGPAGWVSSGAAEPGLSPSSVATAPTLTLHCPSPFEFCQSRHLWGLWDRAWERAMAVGSGEEPGQAKSHYSAWTATSQPS